MTGDRNGLLPLKEPGFYSLPEDIYHLDPCPEPSLSGSLALKLLHRSPRHAKFNHPRLNPDYVSEESKRLDFGTAAHKLLLGAGADLQLIDAENFTTKAAREARDAARAMGKVPILDKDFAKAAAMAKIAGGYLAEVNPANDWTEELTIIWREGDAWCRGMMDAINADRTIVLDYKTTSASARPESAERSLYDLNYHFKAAFYERGLDVLCPETIGRRRFVFLFQEVEPPYECSLIEPSPAGMTLGRKQMTYAIRLWQKCMSENDWPGYGSGLHLASPPAWLETQWLNRELTDDFATGDLVPGGRFEPYTPPPAGKEFWTP